LHLGIHSQEGRAEKVPPNFYAPYCPQQMEGFSDILPSCIGKKHDTLEELENARDEYFAEKYIHD